MNRRSQRWLALGLGVCSLLLGCGKPLSEEECLTLLDRYTEHVIEQARPSASQAERSELILEARHKAKLDPEFSSCANRVSRAEFECAMQAGNADQIERCLM